MNLADNSGTKREEYLKAKINELETNSKNKNIGDLYRRINDFQKLRTWQKMERPISLHNLTVFWLDGRIISLSY